MSWTANYNSELHFIEVVFAGNTSAQDIKEATTKGIALSKELGVLEVLIDVTELALGASIFDLYELPATQYDAEKLDRRIRLAVVLPKSPKEAMDVLFYETASVNRGWSVQSFPTRDKAIEWLIVPTFSNNLI